MYIPYTHYKFLSDLMNKIKFKDSFNYDDNILFNFANFINVSEFYSLKSFKDKYKFEDKLNLCFNQFILECVIKLKFENNFNNLLFLYSFISTHVLDKYINAYINAFKRKNMSILRASNMIDFYIYSINNDDKMNLYKTFNKSFVYTKEMDDFIREPLIKTMDFLVPKNYFIKCYKHKIKFYKCFKRFNIRYFSHKIISIISKSKYKLKDFFYSKDIDTNILNVKREKLLIDNNESNLTLISAYDKALNEAYNYIDSINDLLFNGRDSDFKKLFNVNKDIKI